MDLEISGKRALVTGSTAGIGVAIAKQLASEGVRVVVTGRDRERAEQTVGAIRDDGGAAEFILADLQDNAETTALIEQTLASGPIDILVNNAAVYKPRQWFEIEADEWTETYNNNLGSAIRTIRGFVPGMKERGWGRVINIASGVAVDPFPVMPDYAASKAALVNLTVSLAKALGGTGVTANAVGVGLTRTDEIEEYFRSVADDFGWGNDWEDIVKGVFTDWASAPQERLADVSEIAHVVCFLASKKSSFITGANVRADGGVTAVMG